ncbi:putative mitochondrial hypothetical protein [Leptomonas pyrrhocoris]|uniref:Uncharacterized protein n=1 Tax=Leptomonas pyrrhocoris TaxID=157538 RepID=A0A0M9GA00_LEPPY|nr:putative mitochondrial hypothetical protein [Leptomonas pyrrhocoris]KPA85769.1 putative mitochondrial hypothetical protein [Leptomonas pyrrhocoris]|eukprot:XP_015664208.1 putative mitochondrial hypothetical protein [Leptomonas pyrrhocoris]
MVAALRVQHRLCASQVNRTSPRKAAATSEKEFQREFFEHSLVQRLAAVTVAKFQLIALQQQRAQKAASSEDTVVYMPMFDFVCRVPSLVRDDMFRRQQDAMRWVEASPLLELVDQDGSRIWSNTTPCFMTGSATSGNDGCAPSYNPLLHVRVVAPPEWFQRIEAAESSVPHNTTRSSASTQSGGSSNGSAASSCGFARGLAGEDFRVAVQDALVRALRVSEDCAIHKAAKVAAQQNNSTLNAATADGCDGGCTAAQRSSSVCRYVPLVNALNQIHLEAAEANNNVRVSMPTATQETLQALSMETLEQVVDACGLLVTVGRRLQCDEYPALTAKCLWVVRSSQLPHQRRPSVFVALRHAQDTEPPRFRFVHPRVTVATVANNYGGWGCESNVPTKADVYEILKYIPVNWGSMSHLTIPIDVKKQRIRCSSSQQWFRRQPYYFELRNINGTVEIRRSIVLHPEAHGLTKEEACELLELQLATGEANNLVLLEGSGTPADYGVPLLERTAIKFLLRVCPTYFAPISLVAQRYIKKNLSEAAMVAVARKRPQDFEELTTRFSDAVLLRRRGGADSSRWRAAFVADLEKYPEDVRGIIALCNRMCPSWDRPEFIYVRLGEDEKQAIGGYEGMMRILQRHPTIFRAGKHFVCRADPSNPLTLQEVEPPLDDVTARSVMREENPYQSALDVALVFHYVAPDKEPCTAAYLADCASPAMRCVLPTRLVTVVQQFPKLFACTETSPGVFAIRKLKQRVLKPTAQISEEVVHSSGSSSTNTNNDGTVAATDSDESLIQMLEDEIAEEEHLTKEEVVHAVHTLVPDSGVEAPQLLQWASMSVQRAANEYFGGVLKLTEAMPQHFRVVTTEQAKTIYKK